MAKIPLYSSPIHPDAWHQVRSPGGYEWWHFDAEDKERDRQLVVKLFDGFVFNHDYLRRYSRYRRRPTCIAPPTPSEYPCAHFALYERGKVRAQFTTELSANAFHAATDRVDVTVGMNSIRTLHDESLQLSLSNAQQLSAAITFRPRDSHTPVDSSFCLPDVTGAEHHWVIANPRCDVEASISLGGESITFHGNGYRDHNYGTAPLPLDLSLWMRGRVLFDDSVVAFQLAQPANRQEPNVVQLLESDSRGTRSITVTRAGVDWIRSSLFGVKYPESVRIDDVLTLANGRMIDPTSHSLRICYDAAFRNDKRGTAHCEVVISR